MTHMNNATQLPNEFLYADIHIGQEASFDVVITEKHMQDFERLSGDKNPLHTDEAYAQHTSYGQRVVYGALCSSFFSCLIGMYLPGKHALYLGQQVRYRAPVYVGTCIRVQGIVTHKTDATNIIELTTRITDVKTGVCFVDGVAMVQVRV